MALDEKMLRAAGLPASLISLLVSITRAGERAQVAANNAAVAVDLQPQIAAAVEAINLLGLAPGMNQQLIEIVTRLAGVDEAIANIPDEYDDTALASRVETAEAAASSAAQTAANAAGAAAEAIGAVNGLPPAVAEIQITAGRIIQVMTDGDEVAGPELPIGDGAGPVPTGGTEISGFRALTMSDGSTITLWPVEETAPPATSPITMLDGGFSLSALTAVTPMTITMTDTGFIASPA